MPLKSNKEIIKQFDEDKKRSNRGNAQFFSSCIEARDFYAGNKMRYNVSVNDGGSRKSVNFNKVKPFVSSVQGFMIQMRRDPRYAARIMDNEQQLMFSKWMTDITIYARENANADQVETKQDLDMLVCGLGAVDTNVLYDRNPDGEIRMDRIDPMDMGWSPEARDTNLLDSSYVYYKKKMFRDEAVELFDAKPEDFEASPSEQLNTSFFPGGGVYDKIALETDGGNENIVAINYYQWFDYQDYFRAENPLFEIEDQQLVTTLFGILEAVRNARAEATDDQDDVEDIFDFNPRDEFITVSRQVKRDIDEVMSRFDIDIEWDKHKRRVYYTAVLSGKKVFDKFKSPSQEGFTILFKTGDWNDRENRWFGMVEMLKEPARYANKALTEMLWTIASNSKGGVLYEESAVDSPAEFEKQYAMSKAAVQVRDGALARGAIQPKAQAALPTGYESIFTIANNSLGEVTGINPEFLGNSNNTQVTATLERQRIKQVVSTLANYFDSITLYQKEHARIMMPFVRILAENSENRLVRIIGQDGADTFEELSMDKFADEYDVDIEEAPDSPSQKQETADIMLNLAAQVAPLGVNLYPVAAKYLPIKNADIQELLQAMQPPPQPEPDPQQLQQQQEMQQIIQQAQIAQIANTVSDTALKEASANEKQASANEKQASVFETEANTGKIESETTQNQLENNAMVRSPITNLNINI